MTTIVIILLAAFLVGCEGADPSGPTVNNSGDNNVFNIPSGGTGNTVTTPAPVVVPPVIVEGVEPEA